jgi:uncharacterized DUF497 family protein
VCFEWDERKADTNLEKHGVDFADAAVALEDERALTIDDPDDCGEQRFISLCMDPTMTVLVIVYAWRGDSVRIISARKASRSETRRYEGAL